MNARSLGFPERSFDIALSGFMGWYDCFDFIQLKFTRTDTKASEIWRVLREGGKFVCCSWQEQEDLAWMEATMLRRYPPLLQDPEYLDRRPIGMAYEKPQGYVIILNRAGFREIEVTQHSMTSVSTDEEEWWRQMRSLGWASLLDKIEVDELHRVKEVIFEDLQAFKGPGGIHFKKTAFFVCGMK